jgi:hypothetical protein
MKKFESHQKTNQLDCVPWFAISVLALVLGCESKSATQELEATDAVLAKLESVTKPVSDAKANSEAPVDLPDLSLLGGDASSNSGIADAQQGDSLPSAKKPASSTITVDDPTKPWTTADQLPRDIWEVQYLGNLPVGYLHRHAEVSKTQGKRVFRIEMFGETRVSVQGKSQIQKLRLATLEQDNGDLIQLEGSLEIGDNKQSFKGSVLSGVLRMTNTVNGKVSQTKIDWKESFRGPFAVEQSLIRKPIQEREQRKLKYFDPILVRMVDGLVEADEFVSTPTMLGGTRELLEVRNTALLGESGLKSLVWVDSNGEGYKTFIASANIRTFRTTPVAAQAIASLFELQTLEVRSIPLQGAVQSQLDGAVSESCTYRVTHESKDPFALFSDRTNQRIRSVDAKSADVSVFPVNESQELVGGIAAEERVDPNTLASTELIPAASALVAKLARAILASDQELDPEKATVSEKVRVCQKELFKRVQFKEFDNQVQSINQVIRLKKANAVEHAILMTAVCRSLKIPARIAFGYQYNGSSDAPAMRFHAWVEYRDGDKWIPIDSTEKDPGLKSDRIKVIESSYTDANPYDPFLNVVRMMADLEIKVLPK